MRPLVLLVLAASAFAHEIVTPDPKALQDRVPKSGLHGEPGEGVTFQIDVPPGAENLVVKTTRGWGDIALYLRRAAHPTPTAFDAESDRDDDRPATELIRIGAPEPGPWYARIVGLTQFRHVRVVASYEMPRGTVRPPRMLPEPGTFVGRAIVRLDRPRGTTVRYTTDGTPPDAASPAYSKPLTFSADARLRAVTFGPDATTSIEARGDYAILPAGTIETLEPGVPAHHLAATRGTAHLFKLAIPAGVRRLTVKMEGGSGDAQLYMKRGGVPTVQDHDQRRVAPGNAAAIEVENPAAGDWFFRVQARVGYAGVSLLATLRPEGVDLIAWGPALDPYVSTETFTAGDCEVDEGMITAGTHRLLRFNTQTRNIGTSDLVLGDPEGNPAFEFFACHGHHHFNGFASYQLLDANGQPVALGRKVSFCLLDGLRWDPRANPVGKFHCNRQGIQAGWADVYDAGLPGQWIDITGIAPGTYTLIITMNPDRLIEEADYDNNSASTQVVIPP